MSFGRIQRSTTYCNREHENKYIKKRVLKNSEEVKKMKKITGYSGIRRMWHECMRRPNIFVVYRWLSVSYPFLIDCSRLPIVWPLL